MKPVVKLKLFIYSLTFEDDKNLIHHEKGNDIKTAISFCKCIETQDIQELKKILNGASLKEQTLSSGLVKALEVYNSNNNKEIIEIINSLIE